MISLAPVLHSNRRSDIKTATSISACSPDMPNNFWRFRTSDSNSVLAAVVPQSVISATPARSAAGWPLQIGMAFHDSPDGLRPRGQIRLLSTPIVNLGKELFRKSDLKGSILGAAGWPAHLFFDLFYFWCCQHTQNLSYCITTSKPPAHQKYFHFLSLLVLTPYTNMLYCVHQNGNGNAEHEVGTERTPEGFGEATETAARFQLRQGGAVKRSQPLGRAGGTLLPLRSKSPHRTLSEGFGESEPWTRC